jgi:MoaA/NifB/PqqE/SkfB family radical SAM enzyme
MTDMSGFKENIELAKVLLSNPQILKAGPAMDLFLLGYMRKFKVKNIGGNYIVHSHFPPLNSVAYTRFINEHLLAKSTGPSHAQIGLTNLCPQKCEYCYNRNRKGTLLDKDSILKLIDDLKKMGVFWIGFTGGEPLLNKDIIKITEYVGNDCAAKLFTTGSSLTRQRASDLRNAGLFSVSVSLDHWLEEKHDQIRGYRGAFKTALKAIEIFKETGNIQVGVSAVLSREMIRNGQVDEFLAFLTSLGIDEAWLSETKPSVEALWDKSQVITESERSNLVAIQDKYNKLGKITVNYLGHFEGPEYFGCNAGHKMVYIDSFGEVSPCVFTPVTFGNVMNTPIEYIFNDMKKHFPSEKSCFINKNYPLLQKYAKGELPISKENTKVMLQEVSFDHLSKFFQLYYKQ